ncbi:MAG TPA: hypothetical protein VFV34_11735 [Blastocatellia bacterium]|nr:hypothetical protein [Blastocatellia bacterium]
MISQIVTISFFVFFIAVYLAITVLVAVRLLKAGIVEWGERRGERRVDSLLYANDEEDRFNRQTAASAQSRMRIDAS